MKTTIISQVINSLNSESKTVFDSKKTLKLIKIPLTLSVTKNKKININFAATSQIKEPYSHNNPEQVLNSFYVINGKEIILSFDELLSSLKLKVKFSDSELEQLSIATQNVLNKVKHSEEEIKNLRISFLTEFDKIQSETEVFSS